MRAGVSSFGIGGTNAHMVLASAPATPDAGDEAPSRAILTVSSASRDGLGRAAARLADDLGASPAGRFGQLAWSSNRVKASGRHRLAICAHDRDQAAAALREAAADETSLSAVSGVARGISAGWLFTGQGSQYPGMSRALHDTCAVYRDALAAVDDAMAPHLGRSIRELMFEADERHHRPHGVRPAGDLRAGVRRRRGARHRRRRSRPGCSATASGSSRRPSSPASSTWPTRPR